MDKKRIPIYSDKWFALVFSVCLFCLSFYFAISLWCGTGTVITKLAIFLVVAFFLIVSIIGLVTVLHPRFKYYGSDTDEYKSNSKKAYVVYEIAEDKIYPAKYPGRVIYFKDIETIYAIPNALWIDMDTGDAEYEYYLEIKSLTGQKIVLTSERYGFMSVFRRSGETLEPIPSAKEIDRHYGKIKLFFQSFLFQASSIRILLWSNVSS